MTSSDEESGKSKYEALHELRATIEEQNERAENAVHEAISKVSEVSTGSPVVDDALARFNLALGQMVAQTGDETDALADALAEEAEQHKPADDASDPGAAPEAEGSRPEAANSTDQTSDVKGDRPDPPQSRDEASDPPRQEGQA